MQRIFYIFLIIFFLQISVSFAQDAKLEHLQEKFASIDINKKPNEALEVLDELYQHLYLNQPIMATEYVATAINICDTVLKDSSVLILWKEKLANLYLEQNKLDQAMKYFVEIKNYYNSKNDSLKLGYSFYNLGNIYSVLKVHEIALSEYNDACKIFIKFKDKKAYTLVNIQKAKILYENFQTDTAFVILFNTLDSVQNNLELQAYLYKAIGILYAQEYQTDSSEFYLTKAFSKFSDIKNYIFAADCYLELGKLFIEDENFNVADDYLSKAGELFNQNNALHKQCETKNLLGLSQFYQNNYTKAEKLFIEALEIALNYENIQQKLFSYDYLAQIYAKQGKLNKANEYLNFFIEEQNLYFEQRAELGYAEVILTFQNEEKQREIELLEQADIIKSQQLKNKQQQIYGAIVAMALLLAFAILLYYYMQKQKKVNKLLKEQNRQINLQKKEIESQSRILEKATRNLLKQKDEIQNKNKKITSSIAYASRIQKSMLASDKVFDKYFKDHFIFYKPKETVSGDFYWISEIKEQKPSLFKATDSDHQKIVVAVVDCTGHGVPGAFMSMLGDAYLNQIINIQHIYQSEKILEELHKSIRITLQQEETENNDGMDVALCIIDKKNRTLEYAGAKNPLVYIQNGVLTRIHGDLMSIGGLQREKVRLFAKHTIDITVQTYVYLYSDGYQDQFGGQYGRKFMAKPFRDILFKNHFKPFAEQKEILAKELKSWSGKNYSQMDDITIVGFTL